jgi:hypothetical protein
MRDSDMAEHGAHDYTHGEMVIEEHARTYEGFMKMTKWGSLYISALVLLLTLWFCTPAGFLGAVVGVAVMIVLGTLVLSEKHKL